MRIRSAFYDVLFVILLKRVYIHVLKISIMPSFENKHIFRNYKK